MNETYSYAVKWSDKYDPYCEFIVLWSDHTWSMFRFKYGNPSIDSYKKHFDLNRLVREKTKKEDAIKFIEKKIKEIEA